MSESDRTQPRTHEPSSKHGRDRFPDRETRLYVASPVYMQEGVHYNPDYLERRRSFLLTF
jgi:hypothetical protein